MRRAFTLALCSVLLGGCATRGGKPAADGAESKGADSAKESRTVPGPVQVVGRIIAVDSRSLSVIVELAPYAVMPPSYNGSILIARLDDLRPVARLQASAYIRGRTLGTRLLAGNPQVGNEVVFAPISP
jgi:hypothetical protein